MVRHGCKPAPADATPGNMAAMSRSMIEPDHQPGCAASGRMTPTKTGNTSGRLTVHNGDSSLMTLSVRAHNGAESS